MITKVVNVNLHQPIYERLTAKQGDIASRYLLFHLLDGDKPFDLTGKSVRVYARKPDKTEIFNDLIINDETKGYCTLELTSQCLASAGVVKMELYISESGKVLTSIPFELEVIACINTANGVTSTNEFSALEVALGSLQDYDNLRSEIIQARNEYGTVGRRLDNFDSQLDNIVNESIPTLDKKRFKITRATKKIFDDATVVNINNTGKQAEICGFRSDSDLANYADRDSAVMYVDGTLPTCEILEVVSFTSDSVTVIGNTSEIETGMIIDCMDQTEIVNFNQSTKYSGMVTSVEGQKINVSGWFQLGVTTLGQVPNKNRIIINPVTKLWTTNNNIFLNADSFGWGGVIAEYGLFNRKSKATGNEAYNLGGVDVVNFDGFAKFGFKVRKANVDDTTKTEIGYLSDKSEKGFIAQNSNVAGFISDNDKLGFSSNNNLIGFKSNESDENVAFQNRNENFKVMGNGTIKNLMLSRKIYPTPTEITPLRAYFHFVQTEGTYILPDPVSYMNTNIKIISQADVTISGKMFTTTGDITTKTLTAWRTLELYSDGTKWYIIF